MGRVATYVVAAVAVLAAAALLVFLWLRHYDPLAAGAPVTAAPGTQARSGPVFGGRGQAVQVTFMLTNRGRFSVTLLGAETPAQVVRPAALRLRPHDKALVTLRWQLPCGQSTLRTVQLRYRYLRSFRRTESVGLPFGVTRHC